MNREIQEGDVFSIKRIIMELHRLGKRNLTVAFLEPFYTTVHLVFGDHRVYVCDTFLGPDSMRVIAKIINENGHQNKPIVVFNSHADWDHVWGNCYFEGAMILGHRECKTRMVTEWEDEMKKNQEFQRGTVILTPPTTVFDTNYIFKDDGVEFFHTPGHTIDSSSCYDHRDRILFVGDNIESNAPYVNSLDFDTYISTLQDYLAREWTHVVLGHDPVQTDDILIRSNLEYLKLMKEWKVDMNNLTQKGLDVHLYTLSKLVGKIITEDIQEKVESHYIDAIRILERMEPDEKVINYQNLFKRIVE
ncbi:MAG: MBL fold metallo-hydrolase [Candidatus Thorarchaeota archaeon]|nr:MAG: MBL fold metallo-hydrolase [Candidatus Thorarchaeota archaeon]